MTYKTVLPVLLAVSVLGVFNTQASDLPKPELFLNKQTVINYGDGFKVGITLHTVLGDSYLMVVDYVVPEYPRAADEVACRVVVKVVNRPTTQLYAVTYRSCKGATYYGFDESALNAVKKWKFKGQGSMSVEFVYSLDIWAKH